MSTPDTAETRISASRLLAEYINAVTKTGCIGVCVAASCEANDALNALGEAIEFLEADKRRLDVLEELLAVGRLWPTEQAAMEGLGILFDNGMVIHWKSFRKAADAELARRSNTGDTNG